MVINTAGEPEREARSPRANAVEALGFVCVILVTLWPICFAIGVLGDNSAVRTAAQWPIAALLAWVLVASPWWHRDTAESLGLGNPRRLWRTVREAAPRRRWQLIGAMTAVFVALNFLTLTQWPLVRRFFRLPPSALHWPWLAIALFGVVLSALVVTCLIRYDNFGRAFRAALWVSGALLLYAGTAAVLHRGWNAFAAIDPGRYLLDVIAYVFWGFVQQLVFTAYFGTRLRKAFGPGPRPGHAPRSALIGAAVAAMTIAPAVWLTVRGLYGAAAAPPGMLAWCVVFALPPGAVWGWFYARDPRRLLVATITGSIFGLIHIDSYGLVLVTSGLGTVLAWLFMEDRTRNLTALGFIHGFLGSTFGKLFKGDAAGPLRVDYRVGPWNVEEPMLHMLIGPLCCLAAFLVLAIWCWRHLPSNPPQVAPKEQPTIVPA